MINDIVKTIKKSRKRRKENWEENKKRYWKLPNLERLHYDSIKKEIDNNNEFIFLSITVSIIKIFFYIFAFLLIIKLLFELDKEIFIRVLSILIPVFPLIFKISIIADIVVAVIFIYNRGKSIRKLNKNFGFKTQE